MLQRDDDLPQLTAISTGPDCAIRALLVGRFRVTQRPLKTSSPPSPHHRIKSLLRQIPKTGSMPILVSSGTAGQSTEKHVHFVILCSQTCSANFASSSSVYHGFAMYSFADQDLRGRDQDLRGRDHAARRARFGGSSLPTIIRNFNVNSAATLICGDVSPSRGGAVFS